MRDSAIAPLLDHIVDLIARSETRANIEQSLVLRGCDAANAELLLDYLPAACGRAFLRQIGVRPSDTYRRPNEDGSWGPPTVFADDSLWREVETFVEALRLDPERRKKFGAVARLSAEVDAINNAVNSGKSLADMAGASFASVFVTPLTRKD